MRCLTVPRIKRIHNNCLPDSLGSLVQQRFFFLIDQIGLTQFRDGRFIIKAGDNPCFLCAVQFLFRLDGIHHCFKGIFNAPQWIIGLICDVNATGQAIPCFARFQNGSGNAMSKCITGWQTGFAKGENDEA